MAVAEGTQVDVFYEQSSTPFADIAAVRTFAVAANVLANVTDLGALEPAVNIIEFPVYGDDIVSKITGLDTPGDLTFDLAFDPADSDHEEIAAAVGSQINIAVKVGGADLTLSAEVTLYGMSGIISSASLAAPVDGVSTLSVTVALEQQVIVGQGA